MLFMLINLVIHNIDYSSNIVSFFASVRSSVNNKQWRIGMKYHLSGNTRIK